jgi:excisionase family DNA binding protein
MGVKQMSEERLERQLLRPQEAFEIIGMSRSTGYALLATGEIPSVRIGRSIRIPLSELNRWIDRKMLRTLGEQAHGE